MNNLVTVIYPGERSFVYSIQSMSGGKDTPENQLDVLEQVFAEWNFGSGQECALFKSSRIRSLSVNDLVRVNDTLYQCRSVGWEKVTEEFATKLGKAVANHSQIIQRGPWSCLDDVMYMFTKTGQVCLL